MSVLSWIKQTTLFLWWVIWFSYYWFTFTVIFFLFFCFLCIIDTLYGYSLARQNLVVSSKSRDVGVYRKVTQGALMLWIMVLTGALSQEIHNDTITMTLSGFVFMIIAWFSFGQVTSIVENMGVSAHGKELWFINLLLKIAWIWQEKIEEKVQKYLWNTTQRSPQENG